MDEKTFNDMKTGPHDDLSDRRVGRKAPDAYRTISEVADLLHVPQHVLRFWETRFEEVAPLKSGGGRRYYSPDQIDLLRRISELLYVEGYTIKGVQRVLKGSAGVEPVQGGGHAVFSTESDYVSSVGFAEDAASTFVYPPSAGSPAVPPPEMRGLVPRNANNLRDDDDQTRPTDGRLFAEPPVDAHGDLPMQADEADGHSSSPILTSRSESVDAQLERCLQDRAQLIELLNDVRDELRALRKNLHRS